MSVRRRHRAHASSPPGDINNVNSKEEGEGTTPKADTNAGDAFPSIPWDGQKIVQVMIIWVIAFFIVGSQMNTFIPNVLGIHAAQLSTYGHALGYFVIDLSNLLLTLAIISQSVRPHDFWRMGLFRFQLTLSTLKYVAAACATFPIIDAISQQTQAWFEQHPPDALSTHVEQSLSNGDWAANLVYCCVVSVCTPVWEESIFRGFLLSSLTRYMPVAGAVIVSSLVFTAAHFSVQRSAYLAVLGCVIGVAYARTRNLVAPILVHSLWNFYVFTKVALQPSVQKLEWCSALAALFSCGGC